MEMEHPFLPIRMPRSFSGSSSVYPSWATTTSHRSSAREPCHRRSATADLLCLHTDFLCQRWLRVQWRGYRPLLLQRMLQRHGHFSGDGRGQARVLGRQLRHHMPRLQSCQTARRV